MYNDKGTLKMVMFALRKEEERTEEMLEVLDNFLAKKIEEYHMAVDNHPFANV